MLAKALWYWQVMWYKVMALLYWYTDRKNVRRFRQVTINGAPVKTENIQAWLNMRLVISLNSLDGNVLICHGSPNGKMMTTLGEVSCLDDRFLLAFGPGRYNGIACYPASRGNIPCIAGRSVNWVHPESKEPLIMVVIKGDLYTFPMSSAYRKALGLSGME
jgi:hypothetical protein